MKLVRLTNQQPAPYIIYDRMKTAHEPFHEIIDTYTFSVVTDNIDNCYRALGVIHNLYKPKPARFMDYIAIPKSNGYQSLHTSRLPVAPHLGHRPPRRADRRHDPHRLHGPPR